MSKAMKYVMVYLLCMLSFSVGVQAQNRDALIAADELIYDFGTIEEAAGLASHVFIVRNEGKTPLVIVRITASCGCTEPEWTKEPIAPGKTGEVKVTYNPKGRPGPFYKTVSIYSNGKKGAFSLGIKGNVRPKPTQPAFMYPYSFGSLKLQAKNILFSTIRQHEKLEETIHVINEGSAPLTVRIGKTAHFLHVTAVPATLAPGEIGKIEVVMDAKGIKHKGRITDEIPLEIEKEAEQTKEGRIQVAANLIDDFDRLSAAEKAMAPVAQLSGTLLDFGLLKEKGSVIPLIGTNKVTGTIEIANTGKSPLMIHSITCEDERIEISGGRKEIKPGTTATFKVAIRPKAVKTKIETLINIVCNDPNGPVRLVKVIAEKNKKDGTS